MVISSRTPEGERAKCPVCGKESFVDPSRNLPSVGFCDAPCPSCGELLWFVRVGEQFVLLRPSKAARGRGLVPVLSRVTGLSESELESDPEALQRLELDSLDFVELMAALEDELSE